MTGSGFLQSYSEIAIAIVGFSGVVVALKEPASSEKQRIALGMLILFGSAALAMGVLPQILLEAELEQEHVWRGLSLLVVASQVGAGAIRRRQALRLESDMASLAGPGFVPIMLTSMVIAACNVYLGVFWLYMTNLLLYLLAGIVVFRNLLGLEPDV